MEAINKYKVKRAQKMVDNHEDERDINDMKATLDALITIVENHTSDDHVQPAMSLDEIKSRIIDLFSDDNNSNSQVILSTAHKTKGMEFPTVVLHAPSFNNVKMSGGVLVGSPQDEAYIWFVAITRTQNKLIVLDKECPDWLFGHLPGQPGYELEPFTPPAEQPIVPPDRDWETNQI